MINVDMFNGYSQEDLEVYMLGARAEQEIDYCLNRDLQEGTRLLQQAVATSVANGLIGRAMEDLQIGGVLVLPSRDDF